jgi:MOSC domain-containing protein YiiM
MSKVIEIAISKNSGNEMLSVKSAEAIAGKGLLSDRHFKENNSTRSQITLIELENIDYFNQASGTSIPSINFRRNIITKGVRLNQLIGMKFMVGPVKLKAHDLCRPCKYLQDLLSQKKLVEKLMEKGGLRCEILINGKISIDDPILF